ncbi:hypothetical protein [Aneurinibacillus aneurinilyticus]|uniref:hypothetical protein n=1 Tax=Aneurinibacillus aneurinilyticus TaxID=1391 RepID=UPI0023F3DD7B|nr:hypothetical protein [Aneurinibacillus aneurinilyticus]
MKKDRLFVLLMFGTFFLVVIFPLTMELKKSPQVIVQNKQQSPVTQTSNQWLVQINKPKGMKRPDTLKSPSNPYDTYYVSIKNTKEKVTDMTVNLYHHYQASETPLQSAFIGQTLQPNGEILMRLDLPVFEQERNINIVVLWKKSENSSQQNQQQAFVFKGI